MDLKDDMDFPSRCNDRQRLFADQWLGARFLNGADIVIPVLSSNKGTGVDGKGVVDGDTVSDASFVFRPPDPGGDIGVFLVAGDFVDSLLGG